MRQIRIKFVDMWTNFDPKTNLIVKILQKKYDVVISDEPDYIIGSVCGNDYLNYDGIRIFWTGECLTPDFNVYDYAIGFDNVEFGDRYFRMPLYHFYEQSISQIVERPEFSQNDLRAKSQFANFVYTNKKADSYRESLFEKMSEYQPVISGGRYKNNIGGPIQDKYEFLKQCKFTIACENSSYPGYTTEKILEAFAAQTIPVYWGNPQIGQDFNEKAFINCHRFSSIDDVIKEIRRINENDELYIQMMNQKVFAERALEERIQAFSHFLYNIFDQDKNEAYRRNRSFWGKQYESQLRSTKKIKEKYDRYFGKILNRIKILSKKG